MQKNLSFKILGIICLAMFMQVSAVCLAQEDFGLNEDDVSMDDSQSNTEKSELDVIESLCQKLCEPRKNPKGEDEPPDPPLLKKGTGKNNGKYFVYGYDEVKTENNRDPFKPVITKQVLQPVKRQEVKPVTKPTEPPKPQAPKITPIKLFVKGIVGNEGNRLAIIDFEKEERTISKDDIVEGKFKVVDIYSDRVVVYSNKEQRRHTFKIGGDEKEKDAK